MPYSSVSTQSGSHRMLESGSEVICKDVYTGDTIQGRIRDQRMFHSNILYGVQVGDSLKYTNATLIIKILS